MGQGILMLQRGANATPTISGDSKLLIPTMSSHNSPSGVISAVQNVNNAVRAFDGNFRQAYEYTGAKLGDYIMYTFEKPVKKITEWIVMTDAGVLGVVITLCAIYAVMTDGTEVEIGRFTEDYYTRIFRGTCDVSGQIQAIKIMPLEFQNESGFNIYYANVVGVE